MVSHKGVVERYKMCRGKLLSKVETAKCKFCISFWSVENIKYLLVLRQRHMFVAR